MDRRAFLSLTGSGLGLVPWAALQAGASTESPKYQLGIVTYNIAKDLDIPTILKLCQQTQMAAIEFRSTHKHGVEPSMSKARRAEVKKRVADAGIAIYGCGTACEFHSPMKAIVKKNVELCKQFVELTADIGGKGVKVRPNGFPKGAPEEKTLEQIGKALIPCGQAAKDAGVEIHVEVHGRGTAHPPHMRTMMGHCSHASVGVTWNCNPQDIKRGSIAEYFKLLQPWIRNCHIHEMYHQHTGAYPYRELFGLLNKMGYDRYTLIEMGRFPKDVGARTEILRYYRSLWTELTKA